MVAIFVISNLAWVRYRVITESDLMLCQLIGDVN